MLPIEKREIADRLLAWLKENKLDAWTRAYDMLQKASFALKLEVFDLWKGYDVLLIMGRVERLSSHKSAGRVIDFRPLSEPASTVGVPCNPDRCPFVELAGRYAAQFRKA